jgi:3-hydroxybutyryl-CoA dehydratase
MNVGSALEPFRIESVSPVGMQAWAVFLHDPNPIHLDPAVVKAKGLGERVINQGPANLAYLINMLRAAVPGGFIESLEVRYVDNVFAGDAVEAGGTVTAVSGESGRQKLVCDVWLRADGRGPVLTGSATISTSI